MDDPVLDALRRAVHAAPTDLDLASHLADRLARSGAREEAIQVAAAVLSVDPTHPSATAVMAEVLRAPGSEPEPAAAPHASARAVAPAQPGDTGPVDVHPAAADPAFDWVAAERQVGRVTSPARFGAQRSAVTLADVGGLEQVKARLEAAFLAPLRNPELRAAYAKSLRGGLLLYGPPGCGKTFIARALAGELGASFLTVGIADVLAPYLGESEQNVHAVFEAARAAAPCVLFFDEIDTLGHSRAKLTSTGMQGVVNQLLEELDGASADNEGVFLLGATNQPWDVDPALRRPGRLDRTVLVLPPDRPARIAILAHHLEGRPVQGIDLDALADATPGFSGADLAHLCEAAAEEALLRSARTGVVEPIGMRELRAAVGAIRPSTEAWLETAKNVVRFGRDDGTHAELREYLRTGRKA